jgi:hypothetical protein
VRQDRRKHAPRDEQIEIGGSVQRRGSLADSASHHLASFRGRAVATAPSAASVGRCQRGRRRYRARPLGGSAWFPCRLTDRRAGVDLVQRIRAGPRGAASLARQTSSRAMRFSPHSSASLRPPLVLSSSTPSACGGSWLELARNSTRTSFGEASDPSSLTTLPAESRWDRPGWRDERGSSRRQARRRSAVLRPLHRWQDARG